MTLAKVAALGAVGIAAAGAAAVHMVGRAVDAAMLEDEALAIGRHPFEQAAMFKPGMCRCGKSPAHPVHQEAPTDDR